MEPNGKYGWLGRRSTSAPNPATGIDVSRELHRCAFREDVRTSLAVPRQAHSLMH
jgi:hypothetical protein